MKKLNSNHLKLIAIIAMTIDHLTWLAFPCIATGLYGFSKDEASKIAISTIKEYLKDNQNAFNHIIFNVFKDEDLEVYKKNI